PRQPGALTLSQIQFLQIARCADVSRSRRLLNLALPSFYSFIVSTFRLRAQPFKFVAERIERVLAQCGRAGAAQAAASAGTAGRRSATQERTAAVGPAL